MRVAQRVRADNVPLLPAGVAFFALLALFPAIVAVVSVYVLASIGLAMHSSLNDSFNKTYGSFVGIIALMLWLMSTVLAVLLGAEINAELESSGPAEQRDGRSVGVHVR